MCNRRRFCATAKASEQRGRNNNGNNEKIPLIHVLQYNMSDTTLTDTKKEASDYVVHCCPPTMNNEWYFYITSLIRSTPRIHLNGPERFVLFALGCVCLDCGESSSGFGCSCKFDAMDEFNFFEAFFNLRFYVWNKFVAYHVRVWFFFREFHIVSCSGWTNNLRSKSRTYNDDTTRNALLKFSGVYNKSWENDDKVCFNS